MNNKKLGTGILCIFLVEISIIGAWHFGNKKGLDLGFADGYKLGNYLGYKIGYDNGLLTITEYLETRYGIKMDITNKADGSYEFTAHFPDGSLTFGVELHLTAEHWRDNILLSSTYHTMSLTNFGKDWLADNIANMGGTNVTKFATYIGVSNASNSFDATWTVLPAEITDGGLNRTCGTWADTGTGTWNITYTFSVTDTKATKLYGYYIDSAENFWNCLLAAEQQGVANQKNMQNGDTLKVTIQGSIT